MTDRSPWGSVDIGVFGVRDVPSTYSGYETFLTNLLPELVERGHRVTVYVRGARGDRAAYRGIERVWTPSIHSKQLDTLSHGWTAGIAALVARHDVVLVCNVANSAALAVLSRAGLRAVLNVDGQEWLRGKWGRAGRKYYEWSARSARHGARSLITDCRAMADVYRTRFASESTVIPYGVPRPAPDDGAARLAPLGLQPGGFLFTGGRLVPENHIERIAEEYARTDSDEPLIVAGEANYRSPTARRLAELARVDDRIRPIGHVGQRATFSALLGGARLYVHGHSVGGINPSLLEAMAAGANILALDTVFNREALGDAGGYFEIGSRPRVDFAAAMKAAVDETVAGTRRAAAAMRAEERFSISDVADAYEDVLCRVAAGARPVLSTRWSVNASPD